MGVKLRMTTSYRAQADGQTERQNLILEDALRCMISYNGDDWSSQLATIEYAHATLVHSSTNLSPFEVDTGRKVNNMIQQEMQDVQDYASKFATDRRKLVELARKNLLAAQERRKKYYDRKRREIKFSIGDLVMLDTKNLSLKHASAHTELKKAKLA
ncbi:TPA: hypothetical protein N0F65_005654, partial [Lagenidium giganteum]